MCKPQTGEIDEFLKNKIYWSCAGFGFAFFSLYPLLMFVSSNSPPVRPFRCFGLRLTELLGLVPAVSFAFLQVPFPTGNQSFNGSENMVSQGFVNNKWWFYEWIWGYILRQSNLQKLIINITEGLWKSGSFNVLESNPVWCFQFMDIILLGAGCCATPIRFR